MFKTENKLLRLALQEIMRECAEHLTTNELAAKIHKYASDAILLVNNLYQKNNDKQKTSLVHRESKSSNIQDK